MDKRLAASLIAAVPPAGLSNSIIDGNSIYSVTSITEENWESSNQNIDFIYTTNTVLLVDAINNLELHCVIDDSGGCLDQYACNYSAAMNYQNNSFCEYPSSNGVCNNTVSEYYIGMEAEGGVIFYLDETEVYEGKKFKTTPIG